MLHLPHSNHWIRHAAGPCRLPLGLWADHEEDSERQSPVKVALLHGDRHRHASEQQHVGVLRTVSEYNSRTVNRGAATVSTLQNTAKGKSYASEAPPKKTRPSWLVIDSCLLAIMIIMVGFLSWIVYTGWTYTWSTEQVLVCFLSSWYEWYGLRPR